MGPMHLTTILLAAFAAFVVGAIWYGLLFGARWRKAAGVADGAAVVPKIAALTFAFELLSATMLAHNFARLGEPTPHIKLMISTGLALGFVVPAIGVTYLNQKKPGSLFFIDAGHWLLAYAAMGAVFAFA